jgi:hypothetical protein
LWLLVVVVLAIVLALVVAAVGLEPEQVPQ